MTNQREATAAPHNHPVQSYGVSASILLVEDSAADIRLTQEALADARLLNHLDVVRDGEQALAFLRREPPYERAVRPGLILLDLNLPRLDGREVLKVVKVDPELLSIPVVILTTSAALPDVEASYKHHANGYVTKPVRFDDFIRAARNIGNFWLELVTLPPESRGGPSP